MPPLPQQLNNALPQLTQEAAQGNADAQATLGSLYLNGFPTKSDMPKAIAWFQEAADQGHRGAELALGTLYREDVLVPQNMQLSAQ